jgi:beta-xylosidase
VHAGKGLIDPCPLWDDDGRAYLVHAFAQSRAGIKHRLCVRSMKPDATQLFGDEKIIFHAPERQPTIEGPKFLKKDGWYYILAPAGGVKDGWQVALRSKNIFGPYEDKTVLQQGATSINGPHQGALVDLPNGEWWFAHFQDVGVYGRIVHLQPVIWKNDWPMMGCERDGSGIGEPVLHHRKPGVNGDPPVAVPQTSDEFASPQPGLQWQWHANHRDDWASTTVRPGWLRLASQPVRKANLAKAANLLLQKFPARSFAVETELEFHPMTEGEEAGLVVMGGSYAALCLRKVAGKLEVIFRNNGVEQLLATNPENRVILCVRVDDGGVCRFGFVGANGEWMEIKSLFQAQAGTWIGAKVGLYSLYPAGEKGGHADFNHFRFQPIVVTEFFDAKKMRTGRA